MNESLTDMIHTAYENHKANLKKRDTDKDIKVVNWIVTAVVIVAFLLVAKWAYTAAVVKGWL